MARKQQAEQWAEDRRRSDEEERRQRVMVITEFDAGDPGATLHALADEILRYRLALRLLAEAIGWAKAGAPDCAVKSCAAPEMVNAVAKMTPIVIRIIG